jgi:hypothetical protein
MERMAQPDGLDLEQNLTFRRRVQLDLLDTERQAVRIGPRPT